MPRQFPLFEATGSHRELGIEHGRQAAAKIRAFLEYLSSSMELSRDALQSRALRFLPLFEQCCPHLIEELQGLAHGAELPFADVLACQLRGELAQIHEGACTSFAIGSQASASGEVLIGQTSDNPPQLMDFAYVLHLRPADRPDLLMWTFGGMIGYHGLNEHGVAHFANSLGGGPGWKFALSHYPLKRMILEQRTLDDVLRLMHKVPVCSNGNYMLCDGSGKFLDVELTTSGLHVIDHADADFTAHANHYLCDAYRCRENEQQSLPDSPKRQARIEQLIRQQIGSINVDNVKSMLGDHENYPVGICRHPHDGPGHPMLDNDGQTVTALIAEPARGTLHVSYGNPCENQFTAYTLSAAAS